MASSTIARPRVAEAGRTGKRLLGALLDLWMMALIIFLVARLFLSDTVDVIGLGNSVLHLGLLAALVGLPVALLLRRWHTAILALVPTAAFAVFYGPMFLPRPAPPAGAPTLSLMTYNLHGETIHLEPMLAVIREANADIVAFQELSEAAAASFQTALADPYPEFAYHTFPNAGVLGLGVLSRYPIEADIFWQNHPLHMHLGHQRVVVNVDGLPVTIYNAHPVHPLFRSGRLIDVRLRSDEIQSVLDRAAADDEPVILMGDFNMSDLSEDYRRVTRDYTDAFRERGWGFGWTFPDFSTPNAGRGLLGLLRLQPFLRLDYVFYRGPLQATEATVWPTSGGSDHRPVRVELALLNP